MAASLHITLLGTFGLRAGDAPVREVDTQRMQALVAFLALHRGSPQPRRHVAFTFWPDSNERQALGNLRNLLYRLRRAWPDVERYVHVGDEALCWSAEASCRLDVAVFEQELGRAHDALQRADPEAALAALEAAAGAYGGELLAGMYDDWIFPERERLHQACIGALERLAHLLEDRRAYARALPHAQRLLELDPMREPTYRLLMRLHALRRDRAGALRTYRQCVDVLRRELDLAPEPATQALYDRIAAGEEAVPAASTSDVAAEASGDEHPLVGRMAEWRLLVETWRRTAAGRGHLVVVTGEAGIGKTRLAEEVLAWAGRQGVASARARSYAAEGRLAYAPIVEWLRSGVLRAASAALDAVWRAEVARLLPELRAQNPDLPGPGPLRDDGRQQLFEALARAVLAPGRPLLLFLDDVQWCDQDTLEWLRFLLHFGAEAPLLVLATMRVEEVQAAHPLQELLLDLRRTGQVTEVPLAALGADETEQLARAVAGRGLDAQQSAWLFQETEGNPLFVVESVRAGLPGPETDAGGLPATAPQVNVRALPPTVQAVIVKRLGQLSPPARALAGLAAAVGRAFSFDVLLQASRLDEEQAADALDELWQRRIVRAYGAHAYDFTHDKLREVAYADATPVRRRLLHRRIAEALEAVHAADLDAVSAQVAAHYDLGGRHEEAVAFYRRAAHAARQVGSNRETVQLLTRALGLLGGLPQTRTRDAHELALLTALGVALRFEKGHGADEVEQVFERARGLATVLGEMPEFFAVQRGLWAFHLIRAEYGTAQSLAEDLAALADDLDDDGLRLEGGVALGLTCLWRGALVPARSHLEEAVVLYDPARHHAHALRYGQDPGVTARSLLAYALQLLGHPEQAAERLAAAFALVEARDHPFSRAYALQHAALLHQARGDARAVHDHAEALVALSRTHGFAYWEGPGLTLQGWALAAGGEPARGLALLRRGLARHRATGGRLSSTLWLGLLADACRRNGDAAQALVHVEEALALAAETGERVWEPALHRLKKELLSWQGRAGKETV